ncbi:hypothetical protein ABIE37_002098, partial [Arthrobacter bambusae]
MLDLLVGVGSLGALPGLVWFGCCDCSYWEESSMSRVLSTEQAKAAIGQVQSIIT